VVGVGGRNFIFGLTNGGQIFRLHDKGGVLEWGLFDTGAARFTDLCCAGKTLFAIGTDRLLYSWKSSSKHMMLFLPNDVQQLRQVTGKDKRTVYALTEDGTVLFCHKHHAKSIRKVTNEWEKLGNQKMKIISCGAFSLLRKMELWGIGYDDRAYRFDHTSSTWILFDIKVLDISVTRDNIVYAIRQQDGRLMKWNGSENFELQDLGKKDDNYQLLNISAYKERREVYSVDAKGNLLKMSYC
jgi:hypothetical protein